MTIFELGHQLLDDFWFVLTDRTYFRDVLRNSGVVAAVGFIGTLGVLLGAAAGRRVAVLASRRVARHSIDVGPWPLPIGSVDNVQLRCLVVRYGTDAYIERLASDQERYHGRLQNRVLRNRIIVERRRADGLLNWLIFRWKAAILQYDVVAPGSTNLMGKFLLPVHRRLGTQFKLFFQVRAGVEALRDLAASEDPEVRGGGANPDGDGAGAPPRPAPVTVPNYRRSRAEVEAAREIALRLASAFGLGEDDITEVQEFRRLWRFMPPRYRFHLWFCIDTFGKTETVDGITNNMCFPV